MTIFDRDNWFEIWAVLRANKLRTALTAFGVAWGIFMLIVMLAFGSAMQSGTKRNMAGMATNMMFCWGQTTTLAYDGLKPGRQIRFKSEDIEVLRHLPGVQFVAPRVQLGGWQGGNVVSYEGQTGSYNIFGDLPAFSNIVAFQYLAGRFINQADIDGNRKVAVVGQAVMDELFNGDNPMGKYIKISGVYFQVVGVIKTARQGQQGDRDAHSVYAPFTTLRKSFHLGDTVHFFALTASPGTDGETFETEVRQALMKAHKVDPGDKLAIGAFNLFVLFGKFETVFFALWLISWIVGGFTLLAGIVGVSNIMLIAVKERTKEFGVRKALGATPASVVQMVLMETIALTSIAGLVGIAFGTAVLSAADAALANVVDSPFGPPTVGLDTVAYALGFLVFFAALAGLIPALHAASIKPIEALRTE
ncbi:MAG TPA: ABC transporter permease [Kofleriaceae bacterium]|nr:ABC transporter permease [Kofleriaceae bacterium]